MGEEEIEEAKEKAPTKLLRIIGDDPILYFYVLNIYDWFPVSQNGFFNVKIHYNLLWFDCRYDALHISHDSVSIRTYKSKK